MADIADIQNNELGLSVKDKLNATIAQANKLKDLPAARKVIGNLSGSIADAGEVSVDILIDETADDLSLPTTKAAKDYVDQKVVASELELVNDPGFQLASQTTASSSAAIKAYVDSQVRSAQSLIISDVLNTSTFTGAQFQEGPGIDEDNRWQTNTFTWSNITFASLVLSDNDLTDITAIKFEGGLWVTATGQGSYSTRLNYYEYSLDNGSTWKKVLFSTASAPYVRYPDGIYPAAELEIPISRGLKNAASPIAIRINVSSDNTDNNERVRNYGKLTSVKGY